MFFVILCSVLHYSKCEKKWPNRRNTFPLKAMLFSQKHTQNGSRITIQNKTVFFSIIQATWWKDCNWGHLEGAHFVSWTGTKTIWWFLSLHPLPTSNYLKCSQVFCWRHRMAMCYGWKCIWRLLSSKEFTQMGRVCNSLWFPCLSANTKSRRVHWKHFTVFAAKWKATSSNPETVWPIHRIFRLHSRCQW